ncbi:TIGR03808 family TAT-translocated repetitive protein [Hoeflea sp. YIM 152468]|uniref:TIGR03808 family TAT-translocated repetitive protein n=1 Tax=Hoeflea sp. YIM 152468 TaxID=3031759 RepID=UPI0023DB99E3|nr:TIGR03808 family TAT-translocated repetitive protein [Hoeflea sp. YIM 152468]MDF1608477.1 TIGR03808 family TAT-translocated repetitive protein [Hoeflea sp. YIM 152468]
MSTTPPLVSRRALLASLAGASAAGLFAPMEPASAAAGDLFTRIDLRGGHDADLAGLLPDAADDQSRRFQRAIDAAAAGGRILRLPPGTFVVSNITLPEGARIAGVPGATRLIYGGRGHGFVAEGARRIELSGLVLDGANQRLGEHVSGLVHLRGVAEAVIENVSLAGADGHGVLLEACGGRIHHCEISGARLAGIYAVESRGLAITGNVVRDCANGGILVHRWSAGEDGTLIDGNRVMRIAARVGGTGQNGNGINIFRAGHVMVRGNHVSDCAFSAIRANSASNIQIVSNQAIRAGETAIYAEFSFEGAVIASNLIDGGTVGISVANFNEGGRLAVVQGNIIRNLSTQGPYPAEYAGFGIGMAIEADAAVSGNVIEGAPKWGVLMGWGPFLRAVNFSANTVRDCGAGVAVSVVEGAGAALISNNMFDATPDGAIIGCRWNEVVTGDLARAGADRFRHLTIDRNAVA